MMRLLAEHLGALGGDASSTGAGGTSAAGEGAGPPPGMVSLVDSIMQQLLSKDVLYQPMKVVMFKLQASGSGVCLGGPAACVACALVLCCSQPTDQTDKPAPPCPPAWRPPVQDIGEKYPEWLAANKDKLSAGGQAGRQAGRHAGGGLLLVQHRAAWLAWPGVRTPHACRASQPWVLHGPQTQRPALTANLHLPTLPARLLAFLLLAAPADEYARYQQQHGYIQRICRLYETSPSDFSQLVELLQQVWRSNNSSQACWVHRLGS